MEMYDLGIFKEDGGWTMSPELERAYWDRRISNALAQRRSAETVPPDEIVEVVSFCGAESVADMPAKVVAVSGAIALRIS